MVVVLWERVRAKFLADAPSDQSLQRLETSFSLMEGIHRFKKHKWRKQDLQYCVLVPILLFAFVVCKQPPLIFRALLACGLMYLITVPVFSQFFLPFLPTVTYLLLFYSCGFINPKHRPPIFVRVLPGLETIFYGGDLSATLAAAPNAFCDILTWIPYGLGHFGAPFVVSLILFLYGPPTTLPTFHFAFGFMNIIGVSTQLLFPNAPPWYKNLHGLEKANYSMSGSPGGLRRIDELLGTNLYTAGFTGSPMVFGAFPSLHSADAVMEALFLSYIFPRCTPFVAAYVLWIWWSTMYLTHHYFVDLIGGGILSLFVFNICRITIMAQPNPKKYGRWSYSQLTFGISPKDSFASYNLTRGLGMYDEEAQADSVNGDIPLTTFN